MKTPRYGKGCEKNEFTKVPAMLRELNLECRPPLSPRFSSFHLFAVSRYLFAKHFLFSMPFWPAFANVDPLVGFSRFGSPGHLVRSLRCHFYFEVTFLRVHYALSAHCAGTCKVCTLSFTCLKHVRISGEIITFLSR